MKFLLTMNQIAYFKPETTARRLKHYYDCDNGSPVIFLGYLRLIRLLPRLASRAKPFQPELYRRQVREIYLNTPWEQEGSPWLALFLPEFREFFSPEEWHQLKLRYQAIHSIFKKLVKIQLRKIQEQLFFFFFLSITTILSNTSPTYLLKLRC